MEFINPVLLLIIIAEVCFAVCAGNSSQFLRRAAVYLLTRADVIDLSRRETEQRKKFWIDELGIPPCGLTKEQALELPVVKPFARQ